MQIVAREPRRPDDIERMQKDGDFQSMNPLEDGKEQWVGQLFTPHVRAKINPAAAKLCDGPLHLGKSRLRILKRKSRQADEAVGMLPGSFCQCIVTDSGG